MQIESTSSTTHGLEYDKALFTTAGVSQSTFDFTLMWWCVVMQRFYTGVYNDKMLNHKKVKCYIIVQFQRT